MRARALLLAVATLLMVASLPVHAQDSGADAGDAGLEPRATLTGGGSADGSCAVAASLPITRSKAPRAIGLWAIELVALAAWVRKRRHPR